jgi:hypothetical protein
LQIQKHFSQLEVNRIGWNQEMCCRLPLRLIRVPPLSFLGLLRYSNYGIEFKIFRLEPDYFACRGVRGQEYRQLPVSGKRHDRRPSPHINSSCFFFSLVNGKCWMNLPISGCNWYCSTAVLQSLCTAVTSASWPPYYIRLLRLLYLREFYSELIFWFYIESFSFFLRFACSDAIFSAIYMLAFFNTVGTISCMALLAAGPWNWPLTSI